MLIPFFVKYPTIEFFKILVARFLIKSSFIKKKKEIDTGSSSSSGEDMFQEDTSSNASVTHNRQEVISREDMSQEVLFRNSS